MARLGLYPKGATGHQPFDIRLRKRRNQQKFQATKGGQKVTSFNLQKLLVQIDLERFEVFRMNILID